MSPAGWPCAEASTTIARRSRTGSFAVRLIRANRCPSAIDTARTNTSGLRPINHPPTTRTGDGDSLPQPRPQTADYTNNLL